MPRLLNVNSYHYRRGGSDIVYLEHGEMMSSLGWGVAHFSMHHPENLPTTWSKFFVDRLDYGVKGSLLGQVTMAAKAVYSFEAQRKLRDLIGIFAADIAHLHCIYHHLSPSILPVLKDEGIPVVMTAHDLKIACPAYKMLNRSGVCERCKDGSVFNVLRYRCVRDSATASAVVAIESGLQRWVRGYEKYIDKIVCPSRFFVEKFVEWGWPRERFVYIPNYVDAGAFVPRFDAGSYFLYFGRLAPEKGIATLLRAAGAAGVSVKVVGTGPEEMALKRLNAELGGVAEFLGFMGGESLHEVVRGARAVVLPSEWYENAPLSILESYALGKPVIGAAIGGIPEMIQEGATGWTFRSGSVDELRELLGSVGRAKNSVIEAIGRDARRYVAERFVKREYVEKMLAVYRCLGVGE
jgi:glycosyltransferase involved in cell wall biosynthesis